MGWFSGRHEELLTLLAERQRVLEQALEGVLVEVHEIKTALVVRDPGNRLSADAYQGLRQAVMAGANARRTHLVQLAQIADAVRNGADSKELGSLVEEWVLQAGLAQVDDPKNPALYEIIDGSGGALRVRQPAWVDTHTGSLIRRGTAERIPAPPKASIGPKDNGEAGPKGAGASAPATDVEGDQVAQDEPPEQTGSEAENASEAERDAMPEPQGHGTESTSTQEAQSPPSSTASDATSAEQPSPQEQTGGPDENQPEAPTDGKNES